MIEVVLIVLAVVVGLGVVMRMDVEPRQALTSEPSAADAVPSSSEAHRD